MDEQALLRWLNEEHKAVTQDREDFALWADRDDVLIAEGRLDMLEAVIVYIENNIGERE